MQRDDHGRLGIGLASAAGGVDTDHCVVTEVFGPGHVAGVHVGDELLEINGHSVTNMASIATVVTRDSPQAPLVMV